MADKTPDQLTAATTANDTDLVLIYPSGGPLKKLTFSVFKSLVINALGSTYLRVANNLSDLGSASAARANLGLGSIATLASSAFFQVANNLSEIANAAAARTNLGAASAASPTITGGMDFNGSVKQNTQALAGTEIDLSLAEFFTKSISANTTFTFANATASRAQGLILFLTTSSNAQPTLPASVKWDSGIRPTLANGLHAIGLVTYDGGTSWCAILLGTAFAVPA